MAKKLWNKEDRKKAHSIYNKALRAGKLVRGKKCEICGSKWRIHGHHTDYSKPLKVRWLCKDCHSDIHNRLELFPITLRLYRYQIQFLRDIERQAYIKTNQDIKMQSQLCRKALEKFITSYKSN